MIDKRKGVRDNSERQSTATFLDYGSIWNDRNICRGQKAFSSAYKAAGAVILKKNEEGDANRYISISPSLWFSNGVIFEYEEAFASNRKDAAASVYLSVGGDENQRMKEGSIRLDDTLMKREYPHLKFNFSLVEGENHRSLFPFAFSRGLRFVFSGSHP